MKYEISEVQTKIMKNVVSPSHTLPPLGRFAPSDGTLITPPPSPQSWKQINTYGIERKLLGGQNQLTKY